MAENEPTALGNLVTGMHSGFKDLTAGTAAGLVAKLIEFPFGTSSVFLCAGQGPDNV